MMKPLGRHLALQCGRGEWALGTSLTDCDEDCIGYGDSEYCRDGYCSLVNVGGLFPVSSLVSCKDCSKHLRSHLPTFRYSLLLSGILFSYPLNPYRIISIQSTDARPTFLLEYGHESKTTHVHRLLRRQTSST